MDCIDHSLTTTRLLQMIEKQGFLRYHRVLERVLRARFLIFVHYSAVIEEIDAQASGEKINEFDESRRYVVDSWFFDNGHPAAVMPLANWRAGESPNDSE